VTGFAAQDERMTTSATQTDPRPVFATTLDTAADVIAAVRPNQITDPTPCDDFDVQALLGHLTGVLRMAAAVGRGDNPFALPEDAPAAADGWLERFRANRAEVEAAWADGAALGRPSPLPWASESGAAALLGYVNEVTVHTWDLATATGQRPAWNPDVLAVAAEDIGTGLPAENRSAAFAEFRKGLPPEMASGPDPFRDAVPVADDAPLIDRIVAWSGRRP
jgi:uncharacterized protein (TIGR03086 family)